MSETTEYVVTVEGCDDRNEFRLALTDAEASVIGRLGRVTAQASEYGCQPTLSLAPFKATDYDPDYDGTPSLIEWSADARA